MDLGLPDWLERFMLEDELQLEPWQEEWIAQALQADPFLGLLGAAVGRIGGRAPDERVIADAWISAAVSVELRGDDVHGQLPDGTTFVVVGGAEWMVNEVIAEAEHALRLNDLNNS